MKVILFGAGPFASLAWYCLSHDSAYEVAGFTVDADFLAQPTLHGLPVVDFASVEQRFDPAGHRMLLPLGGLQMNRLRQDRYLAAKAREFQIGQWTSSKAVTWPDLSVGENSMIFEGAIVQPFATIGANTIIRSGCHLSHHAAVADHCYLAPQACLGGGAIIKENCFVGLNATIRNNVTVAERCFIGAGAVVVADTSPDGLYLGTPARRVGPAPMSVGCLSLAGWRRSVRPIRRSTGLTRSWQNRRSVRTWSSAPGRSRSRSASLRPGTAGCPPPSRRQCPRPG